MFDKNGTSLKIISGDERVNYKPSVDIAFASAAQIFGKDTLALVLTGMGSDGREGAKLLKQKGATLWAQNEETCVVYGMPAAVAKAGLVDKVLPIGDVATKLVAQV
jgi:two-component system chemotaxis response regulator CheB